ncbi:hypothetical protein HAX54_042579, partial [Datura stramonium]|nr:hypothetical protein [Datura stramonium]
MPWSLCATPSTVPRPDCAREEAAKTCPVRWHRSMLGNAQMPRTRPVEKTHSSSCPCLLHEIRALGSVSWRKIRVLVMCCDFKALSMLKTTEIMHIS